MSKEAQYRAGHLVRLRPRSETLYVSQGRTVLATARDGQIYTGTEQGLFVHETRLLSRYGYLIGGRSPFAVALSNVEQYSWLGYYIVAAPGVLADQDQGSGAISVASQQTLELRVSRYVGGGMHEDVDLTNFTQELTAFNFALELEADFADQIEAITARQQQGQIRTVWRQADRSAYELLFDYTAQHTFDHQGESGTRSIRRALHVQVENMTSLPSYSEGRIGFQVELPPGGKWHCCLNFIPVIEDRHIPPLYSCRSFTGIHNALDRTRQIFFAEATRFAGSPGCERGAVVASALEGAKRDLAALRLHDLDHNEHAWTMAAGLPIYIALFGRDVLTAAWQAGLLSTAIMKGTLYELAKWSGGETNDWRDEQPGRMLHEAHTGPLEMLNFNPRQRYYGSITTSSFYPVVVSELWHWTGNRGLIQPLVKTALDAVRWLDRCADLTGRGFYEYQTRSSQGVRNQAWKDSGDAIVYEDGSQVKPPIATCEEQGFVYAAKLHLAEVLWWLGEKDEAKLLVHQASELKKRFNDAFWLEEEGFFAMGLDSQGRPIRSIGSNPGHCLATGIADQKLVPRIAARLFAKDLFSGWGIRTLSAEHPAYNPFSYHRGSVWPVEQGTFALGFMRYGLWDCVEQIARAQFDAASLFEHYRLPELFSGHARDSDHPFPALYPQANSPQAWSASSVFCLVQAMLGLYPYAPLRTLFVDPHLPEWLPEIQLANLRVGDSSLTIRFYRKKDGTSAYVVEKLDGSLHIVQQPSPWSVTAGWGERLLDLGITVLPATRKGKQVAKLTGLATAGALAWWGARWFAKRANAQR